MLRYASTKNWISIWDSTNLKSVLKVKYKKTRTLYNHYTTKNLLLVSLRLCVGGMSRPLNIKTLVNTPLPINKVYMYKLFLYFLRLNMYPKTLTKVKDRNDAKRDYRLLKLI